MARWAALSIRLPLALIVGLVALVAGLGGPTPPIRPMPAGDGWTPLFNGRDLDGWYTWLPSSGRDHDPKGIFKVQDGMLHILDIPVGERDQEFGYIATVDEYATYRLRFQYRWGEKRFPPRADEKRDSGLLYHVVGPDQIWPRSLECQVQEGDTGDFFLLGGTGLTTTVESLSAIPKRYQERGIPHTQIDGQVVKSGTYDSLADWNAVEVIVDGGEAVHIVNGVVNNRGSDLSQRDPADSTRRISLSRGRILFQAEGAEVYYRGIETRPLRFTAAPAGAAVLVDGADTARWQAGDGSGPIGWPLVDGSLEVCPGCGDVRTVETFRDFRLHVEFRLPSSPADTAEQDRGNSGIYLQGRYEIQVLDSFGRAPGGRDDGGAIYALKDADTNASLPSETWQAYDIIFRAARWSGGRKTENARLTLVWNGDPVHDNIEIPGPTPGGDPEGPEPGPLVLQDHGQRVRYRNLWIEPLT